jgi:4-diphosphocytidyl-2-C-methyl-D-erythritol kinase
LGAWISVKKNIPMGGGLGGGSSDAACALLNLNRLWNLDWSVERLAAIAAQVGSDVAFFLRGGWCLCRGRGEIVEPLAGAEQWPVLKLVLVLPPLHVATPAVYKALNAAAWDGQHGRDARTTGKELGGRVRRGDFEGIELRNDLSAAARKVEPRLEEIQAVLQRFFPGKWLMSGSGASHFALLPRTGPFDRPREFHAALEKAVAGTRVLEIETVGAAV